MKLVLTAIMTAFIAAFIVSGCRSDEKKPEAAGPVLAEVNDGVITPEDFMITLDLLYLPSERPRYTTPEGRRSLLNLMTAMELFYQEGKRQGLDSDPHIEKAVDNFRRYLVYHTLITRNITGDAIKNYFQRNFVHVAVIKIAKPKNAGVEAVNKLGAKADMALAKLKAGKNFEDMARKYSDHPSKINGGDLGPITATRDWPIEMLRAAAALREVGELSPVVEAPDGFYILKLVEPHGALSMDGLTNNIQQFIYTQMLQQNIKNYATQLQAMADIKLHPEVLEEMKLAQPSETGDVTIPTIPPPGIPLVAGAAAE